ncbi:MAG: head GIN domain-containing protein [Parabacteroides sp.]|nr:head GIN domain-containing protein [Parabacteroides sp.]
MKAKGLLLIAFLFGLLNAGQAADYVKGNGKPTTVTLNIDDFNKVNIDGVMDFSYVQSEESAKLEITLDDNLHQYLDVETTDRELKIRFNKKVKVNQLTKFVVKANSKWLKEVKAAGNANFMTKSNITGDELKVKGADNSLIQFMKPVEVGVFDLNVANSANIVVEDMKVDRLDCDMDGSGSMRLKNGTANKGEFTVLSSGDIHAFGVAIKTIDCKVAGSGTVEINPKEMLKANLVGKGNIRYKGPVTVEQRIIGKGTIQEVKE